MFSCLIQAEARLAARRQARAEAREIRLREMERQRRDMEETSDRHYDLLSGASTDYTGGTVHRQSLSGYSRTTPLLTREVSLLYKKAFLAAFYVQVLTIDIWSKSYLSLIGL